MYERNAVRRIGERLGVVAQSAKLLEHPTLEALAAEHAALQDGCLREFLRRSDSFDIHVKVDEDDLEREAQPAAGGRESETRRTAQELEALRTLAAAPNLGMKESQKSTSSLSTMDTTATSESARLAELSESDFTLVV